MKKNTVLLHLDNLHSMAASTIQYFVFREIFIKMFNIQSMFAPSFLLCKWKKQKIDKN